MAPSFRPHEVIAMLRVEVERRHEETLWYEARIDRSLYDQIAPVGRGEREGPITIMGVALYYVDKLSGARGWRVINPMRQPNPPETPS
jgi:hypothetical protein